MNMKYLKTMILIIIFILLVPYGVTAFHSGKAITPYGDYCRHYSHYGRNKSINTSKKAEEALMHYYTERGYGIEIVKEQKRFLKVNVKKKGKIVDIIIFDKHTGRLRSVY